ncbi:MAG: peptidase C14, partial [Maricaulaceae bacterium]
MRRRIGQEGNASAALRNVSVSLDKLGDLRAAAGDRGNALEAYEESLAIARALAAKDPENTLWARDVSISLDKVGNMRAAAGDRAGALE